MLDNFADNLDNNSDTELLAMFRQINMSNIDILGLEDNASDLKKDKDFLSDGA